jgi:S-layer family protein
MKKKSTSQSAPAPRSLGEGGFFNLRVLVGLFVFLSGVFLALLSFGPATTGFAHGTTREQMTLALAQSLAINPPACVPGQEMFHDVPASSGFCPYIEELARRGITGGCGGGNFCPRDPVTRSQMAVFLVKAVDAVTQSEAFHLVGTAGEPPFQNGWGNSGGFGRAGFFKDALGIVHLKGTLSGPGNGTAFTLPEGYRPAEALFLPVAGTTGGPAIAAYLVIQPEPDGRLQPVGAGFVACDVGLDGLSFRVP